MSTNPSIFDSFTKAKTNPVKSPFTVADEEAPSPFIAENPQNSPFKVVDEASNKPNAKVDSPFQIAEPSEGFGLEPPFRPMTSMGASPFQAAPAPVRQSPFAPAPPHPSPFEVMAAATPATSPFAPAPPLNSPAPAASSAPSSFGNWPEPVVVPTTFQSAAASIPAPHIYPPENKQSYPAPSYEQPSSIGIDEGHSDSYSIRQLELRAIFGVDREMDADEILQRSRSLPGMKNIARVGPSDMATIESLKQLLPNLGFGSGNLRIYTGSVPLEFIREGNVMLAVQTDGGFAPGVRETLMIVARELAKMS